MWARTFGVVVALACRFSSMWRGAPRYTRRPGLHRFHLTNPQGPNTQAGAHTPCPIDVARPATTCQRRWLWVFACVRGDDTENDARPLLVQRLAFDGAAAQETALFLGKVGAGVDGAAIVPHQ